ncbi:helix-turn-helix domain-containing protein [Brevibacillus sp. SYP-B805]|uniref:helix-turn-helix domain-containing protein n=1 Tax=Brevibacillus sp. SYP-B805 TaxID=1578199 RepID=UPI0013EDE379|nr:helix-turn-helix transcriptional regulator [Brevibacillus sp. SYP-B805]NGQ95293.1 helix-turn-helix domain-containing protein [Brevibacillus sp. SYP-B805]
MTFGEVVRRYRERENLTVTECALRTGINRSVWSRIESGDIRRPGLSTSRAIASALAIPYEQVILYYLDNSQRGETLKKLLHEAVLHTNRDIVRKAALKLLETPKMNSFLTLDYLLQLARETEKPEIKLSLLNVIIEYTKKHGIPFYLAKALFEQYQAERDDFSRLEETYRKGKELLHYIEYLQPDERIAAYYRLGIHAYVLDYYGDSIELCSKGLREDQEDSKMKASALITIISSYLYLGDLILADYYLPQYESSAYADFRAKHLRAFILAKKGRYEEAIDLYKASMEEATQLGRISIAHDILEVCMETGRNDIIEELIQSEHTFLPLGNIDHPNKVKNTAAYYQRKGMCLLSVGQVDEGIDSLIQALSYYRQIGRHERVTECICHILEYHRQNHKNLSIEYLEKITQIIDNRIR